MNVQGEVFDVIDMIRQGNLEQWLLGFRVTSIVKSIDMLRDMACEEDNNVEEMEDAIDSILDALRYCIVYGIDGMDMYVLCALLDSAANIRLHRRPVQYALDH